MRRILEGGTHTHVYERRRQLLKYFTRSVKLREYFFFYTPHDAACALATELLLLHTLTMLLFLLPLGVPHGVLTYSASLEREEEMALISCCQNATCAEMSSLLCDQQAYRVQRDNASLTAEERRGRRDAYRSARKSELEQLFRTKATWP